MKENKINPDAYLATKYSYAVTHETFTKPQDQINSGFTLNTKYQIYGYT